MHSSEWTGQSASASQSIRKQKKGLCGRRMDIPLKNLLLDPSLLMQSWTGVEWTACATDVSIDPWEEEKDISRCRCRAHCKSGPERLMKRCLMQCVICSLLYSWRHRVCCERLWELSSWFYWETQPSQVVVSPRWLVTWSGSAVIDTVSQCTVDTRGRSFSFFFVCIYFRLVIQSLPLISLARNSVQCCNMKGFLDSVWSVWSVRFPCESLLPRPDRQVNLRLVSSWRFRIQRTRQRRRISVYRLEIELCVRIRSGPIPSDPIGTQTVI